MAQPLIFYAITEIETRRKLRKSGHGLAETNELMNGFNSGIVDAAATQIAPIPDFGATVPVVPTGNTGAIGDGSILKAVEAFFASPLGQTLIQMLETLLLGLIPK